MSNKPVFDFAIMNSQMALIANFNVQDKHVMFLYHSPKDACHVLIDNEPVGYFIGDNIFYDINHKAICSVQRPTKAVFSFEKEFIPAYVSTVTKYILGV